MNKITIRISKKINSIAKRIDTLIKNACGERIGFMLIVYTPERASYISSIERKENIKQMKAIIELWESGEPDVKAHEVKEDGSCNGL